LFFLLSFNYQNWELDALEFFNNLTFECKKTCIPKIKDNLNTDYNIFALLKSVSPPNLCVMSNEKYIVKMRECFLRISKQKEQSWKYDAQWIIFDIRGDWIANEMLSWHIFSIRNKNWGKCKKQGNVYKNWGVSREVKSSKFMIITTSIQFFFDFLCINFMNYLWVKKGIY